MSVSFHCAEIKFTLPQKQALKRFIKAAVKEASGKKARFTYVFCSDEYLLQINRQFLNHDFYTDIITFPLNETEREIEAEIYISLDRVRENAIKFKVNSSKLKGNTNTLPASLKGGVKAKGNASTPTLLHGMEKGEKTKTLPVPQEGEEERLAFERELQRVIFHGALHLVGFQDKTKKEQSEMRRMEEEWMQKYNPPILPKGRGKGRG